MSKVKCAIIGSGNIGTDLLFKLLRSKTLEPVLMVGIDPSSRGLAIAREHGLTTVDNGIDGFLPLADQVDIVFEATSAKAHLYHAPILKKLGKKAIDLTPAAVGPFMVPAVSLDMENLAELDNVNMVTCGGQATIPIVKAIQDVVPVRYAEIVASIASKSAGPGTRQNIDEFTVTTARAIKEVAGVEDAKAIIILNPAEPPILMRNTIYAEITDYSETIRENILKSLYDMLKVVQSYVPGYRFKAAPVIKENLVTVTVEVEGNGDYLPKYAGNLDIITAAAVKAGEVIAETLPKKGVER